MIKEIAELNFPPYATFSQATITEPDMGSRTIESVVKIDGDIKPDFTYDWMVMHKGHHYIHPLKKPQVSKGNTSLLSENTLTFYHWAEYQLRRYFFAEMASTISGTAIPNKRVVSLSLTLGDLVKLFQQELELYYGGAITIDLNPDWVYSDEPALVSISYTFLWDLLQKFYELYSVRWVIVPTEDCSEDTPKYVIKVGYAATELSHVFEYGFSGGLLKVERAVQSDTIKNCIEGRGGTKNLPCRYFKDIDTANPSFRADPDWIPELSTVYFDRLLDKNFRDYVKGWKTNPKRKLTDADGNAIIDKSTNKAIAVEKYDSDYGAESWAYRKGATDAKFLPVEHVKDDESIEKYGELWDGLDDNDEIFPTIQGISVDPYGRVDEAVDVEQVLTDNIVDASENEAQIADIQNSLAVTITNVAKGATATQTRRGFNFTVPTGMTGDLEGVLAGSARRTAVATDSTDYYSSVEASYSVAVYDADGNKRTASGIPSGSYYYEVTFTVKNDSSYALDITTAFNSVKLITADKLNKWTNRFDIWVKNIWGTTKSKTETDEEYASRVWNPILGDRWGDSAKVVFSTGALAVSEDYEFVMLAAEYDTSKQLNGVASEWKLTLAKSSADYDTLGVYVPGVQRQGRAGDHFFFIGFDMPQLYVEWGEQALHDNKTDALGKVKDVDSTWNVTLDKVRIGNKQSGEASALVEQLCAGALIRLADKRYIDSTENLYLQSITTTYSEGALIPETEIVLSNEVSAVSDPVATIQGEVSNLSKQLGSVSNVEQIIRTVCDKMYLRRDGVEDLSFSPTSFASLLKSRSFRSGLIGGEGWGFYQDSNGNWVLEIDRLDVRQEMNVANLVINQISVMGGKEISSAARMEVTEVIETSDGYRCYFDQKKGSVKNLFVVDDVALSEVYDADNNLQKYYKRKVVAVGVDYITLSKTVRNGSGIPMEGDVIAQYGNYSDSSRRYVVVRDVVGGAYERFIEDLSSVSSAGTEYYFAGKADGSTYRFFLGNKNSGYLEWFEDTLRIRGQVEMLASSTIEGKSVADYVSSAANAAVPYVNRNYFLNSAFTNQLEHYRVYPALTCEITNDTKHGGNPSLNVTGEENDSDLQRSLYQDLAAARSGTKLTFSVWTRSPRLNSDTQSVWWIFEMDKADGSSAYGSNLYSVPTAANEWQRFTKTITTPDDCTGIKIWLRLKAGTNILVSSPKAEYGEKATDWIAAPEDISELNAAATDTANNAAALLAEWAEGGVISPTEQQAVRMEYNNVITERESLIAQMEQYGMKSGTYRSVYVTYYSDSNSYAAELKKLITDSGESVRISDADYFKTIQEAYYTDRQKVLTALSTAAQSYVDDNFTKPGDIAYLTDAIAKGESTTVDGGLVLTTKVNVGTTDSGGTYTVNGGLNGAVTSPMTPIIWGGGNMYDRSSYTGTDNAATFLFRADGTGYVCSDYIRFNPDYMGVGGGSGEFLRIDSSGLHLLQDYTYERLEVADKELDVDVDTISAPSNMEWLDSSDAVTLNNTYFGPFAHRFSNNKLTMKSGDVGAVNLAVSNTKSGVKFTAEVAVIEPSGSSVASVTVSSAASNGVNKATANLAFTAPKDGTYYVRVGLTSNGTASTSSTSSSNTTMYYVGTFSTSSDLGTKIGLYNNALYAAYASSVLLHRQDIGIWRVGKAALRLLPDGSVQIQKDGKTWTDL